MEKHETIYLAGGCFWGMQDLLRRQAGVLHTRVGYCGGDTLHATYEYHGSHAETVEVIYDTRVLPTRQLLEFFFQIHDPTTLNRQGNDRGSSYRSAIFHTNPQQQFIASALIADMQVSNLWPGQIVTEIRPAQLMTQLADQFWEAEPEHQDYLLHYPQGYTCHTLRPAWRLPVSNWAAVLYHAYSGNFPPTRRMVRKAVEWHSQLTPEQYYITRQKGTESAFSYQSMPKSCSLFEPGTYGCVCCNTPLFTTQTQYESHSGWPSFTQSLPSSVIAYHADSSHGMERIEVTCNVCDAHLGHVFPDGPQPTGLRYCINSVALTRMVIPS